MAQQFSFGENIAGAVGNTLQRNQQAQQFAAELDRRLKQDAFNRRISELAHRLQKKKFALQQEKFDYQMIQDAITRDLEAKEDQEEDERQKEIDELNRRKALKYIENIDSIIKARERPQNQGGPDLPTPNKRLEILEGEREPVQQKLSDIETGMIDARDLFTDEELQEKGIDPDQLTPDWIESLTGITSSEEELMRKKADQLTDDEKQRLKVKVDRINKKMKGIAGFEEDIDVSNLPVVRGQDQFKELASGDLFIHEGEIKQKR